MDNFKTFSKTLICNPKVKSLKERIVEKQVKRDAGRKREMHEWESDRKDPTWESYGMVTKHSLGSLFAVRCSNKPENKQTQAGNRNLDTFHTAHCTSDL